MNHIFLFTVTRNINLCLSSKMHLCRSRISSSNSFIVSIIFFSLLLILNIFFLHTLLISLICLLPGGSPATHRRRLQQRAGNRRRGLDRRTPTRYYNQRCPGQGGFYKAGENVKTGCRQDEYMRKYRYVERAGIMCMNSRNLCNRPQKYLNIPSLCYEA